MAMSLSLPSSLFHRAQGPQIAIDLGTSVIKVVYHVERATDGHQLQVRQLRTKLFSATELEHCLDFIRNVQDRNGGRVVLTGLNRLKYRAQITKALQRSFEERSDLNCIVSSFRQLVSVLPKNKVVYVLDEKSMHGTEKMVKKGMMLLHNWVGAISKVKFPLSDSSLHKDCYKWRCVEVDETKPYVQADPGLYPCLLVMCGSNCVITKLEADGTSQFVGLHPRCGRTLQSMAALYLGVKDFGELLTLAENGDNAYVDLMRSDMHADSPKGGQQNGTTKHVYDVDDRVCDGYGKAVEKNKESFRREDIMRTIVSNLINILSTSVAFKAEEHGVRRVFFGGSLITHPLIRHEFMRNLGDVMIFMPQSEVEYSFLAHGEHYGALGALFGNPENNEMSSSN